MSQDYYRVIAGKKYDNQMIEIADESVAGRGDGRISLEDAHRLIAAVKDANLYTDIEKATMRYIRDRYRFTPAADRWFRTEIRKWAAIKGAAAHSGDREAARRQPSHPVPLEKDEEAPVPPPEMPSPSIRPAPPAASALPEAERGKDDRHGFNRKIALAAGVMTVLIAVAVWAIWPTTRSTSEPVAQKEEPPASASVASVASTASDPSDSSAQGSSSGEENKAASNPREDETPAVAASNSSTSSASSAAVPAAAAAPSAPSAPSVQADSAPPAVVSRVELQEKKELSSPPEPGTQGGTHIVQRKESLWSIAKLWYRDPTLWPNVYRVNRGRIPDPNLIYLRMEIAVPSLQGTVSAWTARDRSLIAAGYVDAYQAYKKLGRPWARPYLVQAGKWDATVMERMKALGR